MTLLLTLLLAVPSSAAIKTETIEYRDGDTVLEGFLAYDDSAKGKKPGVAVVHEWFGMGDYSKRRAKMLAELGYVAFAIDMYGKGVYAKDHEEAGKLSGTYRNDRALMRKRARAGADLKSVASFHGGLTTPTPAIAGAIKAKIAVHTGADDKNVAPGIPEFEDEMRKANADYFISSYGGAVHSFTVKDAGDDPSKGAAYNEAADRRSWESLKDFLAETLR